MLIKILVLPRRWIIVEHDISESKFRHLILVSFQGFALCLGHKIKAGFFPLAESSEEESDDEIDKDSDVSNLFAGAQIFWAFYSGRTRPS